MPVADDALFIGIDAGTSQCRACALDRAGNEVALSSASMPAATVRDGRIEQWPSEWWSAVSSALDQLVSGIARERVAAIAVAGTSGTLLVADAQGHPAAPALMYNDQSSVDEAARIEAIAPVDSIARGASSALAKLLQLRGAFDATGANAAFEAAAASSTTASTGRRALHQADWLAGCLRGEHGMADENNVLKLGYDPVARRWPSWLARLGVPETMLPRVVAAGVPIGVISPAIARGFGLRDQVQIVAGTTDSVAAAIAAGARDVGDAVTSLGSTLVLKVVTARPISSPAHGVYTHRVGNAWLAGGASNTGGAVLASLFTRDALERLSASIDPAIESPFNYYPLALAGERFPTNDPFLAPRLVPRPSSDRDFLHGVLESMARIERDGYRLLQQLGAPYPRVVATAGGGARNEAWRRIRERVLQVPVVVAQHAEAAYGAALLARQGALA